MTQDDEKKQENLGSPPQAGAGWSPAPDEPITGWSPADGPLADAAAEVPVDAGLAGSADASPQAPSQTPPPSPPSPQGWWPPQPPAWQAGPGWQPQPPQQGWAPQPPQAGWPPQPQSNWPPQPQSNWPPQPQPNWPPQPPQQGWPPQPPQQGWPPQPRPFEQGGPSAGGATGRPSSRLPLVLAVIAACLISFSGGMVTDHYAFPATATNTTAAPGTTPGASGQSSTLYNEALQIVKENYVGISSITDQELLYGSIKGMIDSLGDTGHSSFLTAAQNAAMQSELSGSFAGIGVVLSADTSTFKIVRVISGSPAAIGGVKAGDQITAVGGVSTSTMTVDDLTAKIRGAAGSTVTISVLHLGAAASVDITMTRATIAVPLVDWGMVPGTHVADIALTEFSTGASDEMKTAISSAKTAGATSIILDLRGNPGGYATEAQEVASEFLSSGVVYMEQDSKGHNTNINVDANQTHTNLPLVVLVDHDSASSAEIVAGALQDSGRAKIVGVATYGTGTVLQQFTLSDGSVILLGTAYWLTPNGHKIFGVGITPDEKVAMPTDVFPIDPADLTTMTSAQLSSSGDAELLAAVNDLK
jgi:carboxyl-terminal processing protease